MKPVLSLSAFGHATSVFLSITFVLCVAFDLLFPSRAMYQAWQNLLPGFTWIRLVGAALPLVSSRATATAGISR